MARRSSPRGTLAVLLLVAAAIVEADVDKLRHDDTSSGPSSRSSSAFGNLPPASVSRFVPETSSSWRGNDALRFSSTVPSLLISPHPHSTPLSFPPPWSASLISSCPRGCMKCNGEGSSFQPKSLAACTQQRHVSTRQGTCSTPAVAHGNAEASDVSNHQRWCCPFSLSAGTIGDIDHHHGGLSGNCWGDPSRWACPGGKRKATHGLI